MSNSKRLLVLSAFAALVTCAPPPKSAPKGAPPASSSAAQTKTDLEPPPEPALPKLRTGSIEPVEHQEPLALGVAARGKEGADELVRIELPPPARGVEWAGSGVTAPGVTVAFVDVEWEGNRRHDILWLRSTTAGGELKGDLYTPSREGAGHHFRFVASGAGSPTRDLAKQWRGAMVRMLRDGRSAFYDDAARRIEGTKAPPRNPKMDYAERAALVELMGTTTGRSAVESALARQRELGSVLAREKRSVPLAKVQPPAIPRADYRAMLAALGTPVPDEPMAAQVPADFYYVRANHLTVLLDVLDLIESWGQPAADVLDGSNTERGTGVRYQAELGLSRSGLTRLLGPKVVGRVAIVGSDPYVHDGTDLTVLFEVKDELLFTAGLGSGLAAHAQAHGGVTTTDVELAGVKTQVTRSADGRVRQHLAHVGKTYFVSNSKKALERVLAAASGKAPRLADEEDFKYLLARDASAPGELVAFAGDRFVSTVIGPAQKIAQARRALALGELYGPNYAAMTFGWLNGRSPKDLNELLKSKLLQQAELRHGEGGAIEWAPGSGSHSRFGSVSALEPLIDLPPVTAVSPSEQAAYGEFASYYSGLWTEYVDPVMLKLAADPARPGELAANLRALPLLRADNRDFIEIVGASHISVPALAGGARLVLGIGKDARLRRELSNFARFGGEAFEFDWLGDYVGIGTADRAELAAGVHPLLAAELEPPSANEAEHRANDELAALASAYLVVGLRHKGGAALALAALQKVLDDVAPNTFTWKKVGEHRGVAIVEVRTESRGQRNMQLSVFYALCPQALVASASSWLTRQAIDDQLDGKVPRAVPPKEDGSQLVLDLALKKGGALSTVLIWLLEAEQIERDITTRASAEVLLRGVPESQASAESYRKLARAYLGHVPLSLGGKVYSLAHGEIVDPDYGSAHRPVWPALPVAGSPITLAVERLRLLRSEVSFETEPGSARQDPNGVAMRSFHAKLKLDVSSP